MMYTNEKRHDYIYIYILHLFVYGRDKAEEMQRVGKKTPMRRKLKRKCARKCNFKLLFVFCHTIIIKKVFLHPIIISTKRA